MKKIICLILTALFIGLTAVAEEVIYEYRGTKARDSWTNPCKGETIRVCARVKRDIQPTTTGALVTSTLENENGMILNTLQDSYPNSVDEIVAYLLSYVPDGAVVSVNGGDADTAE